MWIELRIDKFAFSLSGDVPSYLALSASMKLELLRIITSSGDGTIREWSTSATLLWYDPSFFLLAYVEHAVAEFSNKGVISTIFYWSF